MFICVLDKIVKPYLITGRKKNAYYSAGSMPHQSQMGLELWKAYQHFVAKCPCRTLTEGKLLSVYFVLKYELHW